MRRTLAALALTLALPGPALLAPPARAQAVVVVREGDTLSDIAERHGVGLTRLMQANGISDPDLVVVGQRLTIPGGGARSGSGTASGRGGSVTVQAGDTLSDIAARHGISVSRLMQANGISDPDLVVTGQRLTIPGTGGGSSSPATRSPQPTAPYTVKSGETLSDIATRFNTSTERLIQLNGLRNPDLVMSGTRLQVPVAPKRQSAKPASAPTRPAAPDRNARQHVVESGESLSVIAGRYGTTVEQLVALNRIEDPDRLLAGTRLQLRGAPPAPAARPAASPQQAAQPAPRPAPQPAPQPQAQPQPQPQAQPQAQPQPRPQAQASTEPAAAARSQPAAVMPTRESTPTASRTEPAPTSTTTTSPARAAATAGTAATTAPAASTASAATAARASVASSAASARSTANAPAAAAATATPQPRTQPQVQSRPVQPASVRTTAPSTSRIAAATQGVTPTQAATAPTSRSTTAPATTAAASTATSTVRSTRSAAALTSGTGTVAKGAATGSSTVAARSTSRTSASSGDWRSYGPLQIDWANWQSMGGSYVAPSLNSDGKARYLAVNCTARKLNTTTPAGQWNSWESPGQDFEKKLVQDICKEKGS